MLLASCGAYGTWQSEDVMIMEAGAVASASRAWQCGARISGFEEVRPIFMLRHAPERLAAFESGLWNASTPGHPQYGRHLNREEAAALLPPLEGSLEAVITWLKSYGVEQIVVSASSDIVEARMPARVAEVAFGTRLHHFHHTSGLVLIRAVAPYSMPRVVGNMIYLAGDIVHLPRIRNQPMAMPEVRARSSSLGWRSSAKKLLSKFDKANDCGNVCDGLVTPAVLQATYGFPPASADPNSRSESTMGVASFAGISYDARDLTFFQQACGLNHSISVDQQVGAANSIFSCSIPLVSSLTCTEALLDVEYIKAVGGALPLSVLAVSEYSLLKFALLADTMTNLPLVLSISYGTDENQTSINSRDYMDAVNAQFMKLGHRGTSLLAASGDQGAYGREGDQSEQDVFHPDFPASSPYITAVGGTDFREKDVIGEEKAWTSGGGGFSNEFSTPPYQAEAVKAYISRAAAKGLLPPQHVWNRSGRGYPDLAALAGAQNPYCIGSTTLLSSRMSGVAGTSAACPVVAGLIARLNAERLEHGMPPMGFLNPFIYQNFDAFNDITSGANPGTTTGGVCGGRYVSLWSYKFWHSYTCTNPHGFAAMPGWDPATGVGTPNYPALVAAALGQATVLAPALASTQQDVRPLAGVGAAVSIILVALLCSRQRQALAADTAYADGGYVRVS